MSKKDTGPVLQLVPSDSTEDTPKSKDTRATLLKMTEALEDLDLKNYPDAIVILIDEEGVPILSSSVPAAQAFFALDMAKLGWMMKHFVGDN